MVEEWRVNHLALRASRWTSSRAAMAAWQESQLQSRRWGDARTQAGLGDQTEGLAIHTDAGVM